MKDRCSEMLSLSHTHTHIHLCNLPHPTHTLLYTHYLSLTHTHAHKLPLTICSHTPTLSLTHSLSHTSRIYSMSLSLRISPVLICLRCTNGYVLSCPGCIRSVLVIVSVWCNSILLLSLRYSIQCCTVLWCDVMWCGMLWYALLCYTTQNCSVLCCAVLHCTVLYCSVLFLVSPLFL